VESALKLGQKLSQILDDDSIKIRVFLFHCEILLQAIGNDKNPSFAPIVT
jgi:hypothetical protein